MSRKPGVAPTDEDGRVQRGARNRERILDALLELVRAGELLPTAEQVAARAQSEYNLPSTGAPQLPGSIVRARLSS